MGERLIVCIICGLHYVSLLKSKSLRDSLELLSDPQQLEGGHG